MPKLDEDTIFARIDLLSDNLSKLLEHSYHTRDMKRVNDVLKAVDFYQNLLKKNGS